jgi:TetR/AcrR family transcriptional regulator, transcriptional repressor for nem operon
MILERTFYNTIPMRRFLQAGNVNEMARPREFDEQAVLDAATQRFWVYGYEATSMRDLADDMKLSSASLYNAFGDKRALYRRILDRYAETALLNCATVFGEHNPPPRALKQFFDSIVAEALHDPLHKGCLVVNTSLEVAPHDDQFREVVTNVLGRIEKYFRDCIAAGQLDGTLTTKQPAGDLARLFLGAMLGIRVLARARPDPKLLTGIVEPLLRLLRDS